MECHLTVVMFKMALLSGQKFSGNVRVVRVGAAFVEHLADTAGDLPEYQVVFSVCDNSRGFVVHLHVYCPLQGRKFQLGVPMCFRGTLLKRQPIEINVDKNVVRGRTLSNKILRIGG